MKGKSITISAISLIAFFMLAGFVLGSCQSKTESPQPPEIAYGRDQCDQCGMIISEERFASGLQLENGDYLKFDDTGEMIKYYTKNPDIRILAWWVHDYENTEWIRGEDAYFVKSALLHTPMGTGILAFRKKGSAEQFAAQHDGTVYTLDEVRSQVVMANGSQ